MDIRIDLSQIKTIPKDLQVAAYHFMGDVRDYTVKALREKLKSERLGKLIEGGPVTGPTPGGSILQVQIEARPVPAIPARSATLHELSGKTKEVTIDATQPTNVIRILAEGRGAVFPTVKRGLLIGLGSVVPTEGAYLSAAGTNVNGFDVPAQNYIVRQSSRGVAAKPFVGETVEMVNAQLADLTELSFREVTVR